jgi:hypothetical protein
MDPDVRQRKKSGTQLLKAGSANRPRQKGVKMNQEIPSHESVEEHRPAPHPQHINIVVEVNGRNKALQFDSSPVTGKQIREAAGVPLTDDLTRLEHGKPTGGNIGLEDLVDIHNGDHFIALPTGTVS